MPDLLNPTQHRSAFLSALDWLGNTSQIPKNLLAGNPEGALRHAADFLSGPVRALIPGDQSDWELSRPEDNVSISQLTGLDPTEHPILSTAANVVGDTLLDPLTYLTFGAGKGVQLLGKTIAGAGKTLDPLTLIGKGASAGLDALSATGDAGNQIASGVRSVGQGIKSGMGWLKAEPEAADNIAKAQALRNQVASAHTLAAKQAFEGIPEQARNDAWMLRNNVIKDEGGLWRQLGPQADQPFTTAEEQQALHQSRAAMSPWDDARKAAAVDATNKLDGLTRTQWAESVNDIPIFERPSVYRDAAGNSIPRSDLAEKYAALKASTDSNVASVAAKMQALHGTIDATQQDLKTLYKYRDQPAVASRLEQMAKKEQDLLDAHAELSHYTQGVEDMPEFKDWTQQTGHTLTPLDAETHAPADYVMRKFGGLPEQGENGMLSQPNALKSRTVGTGADLAGFLNESGAEPLTNVAELAIDRAQQQGAMASRAFLGKTLGGDSFSALSNPASKQLASDMIEHIRTTDPDTATLLSTAYKGLPPRNILMKAVAYVNSKFKGPAVYGGLGIAKVASMARNAISHGGQIAASEVAGGIPQAISQILATPATFFHGAIRKGAEAYAGMHIPDDAVSGSLKQLDDAMAQSGGRIKNAYQILSDAGRPDLVDALQRGVVDSGYVSADTARDAIEQGSLTNRVVERLGLPDTVADRVKSIAKAPQEMFQATENYARLKTFMDNRARLGGDAPGAGAGAGAAVRDALYDYNTQSAPHRLMTDLLPFFKFTSNATRQGAQFISRAPAAGIAANALYNQPSSGPIYPYLNDQMRIPLGKDEQGNDEYVAGLSLPIEALNMVPNATGVPLPELGQELRRGLLSASSPVIKTGYGLLSGKDPYFDTPYGSYDKVPLLGSEGKAGELYNMAAGSGLIQPLDTPLRFLDRMVDPRRSLGERAFDSLSGANFVSVDPDQARVQQLQEALSHNPDVRQYQGFSGDPKDEEAQALLKAYHDANQKAKQDRDKAKAQALLTHNVI